MGDKVSESHIVKSRTLAALLPRGSVGLSVPMVPYPIQTLLFATSNGLCATWNMGTGLPSMEGLIPLARLRFPFPSSPIYRLISLFTVDRPQPGVVYVSCPTDLTYPVP